MGCLTVCGVKFYVLAAGECYPDPHANNEYVGAYVVFPYEGKWLAQQHESPNIWFNLTEKRFNTENEAFNYVYNHHSEALKKRYLHD